MAIRVLLDHGVQQSHIIFVTFVVAQGGGISVLRRAFPKIKIVCGAVDGDMKEVLSDMVQGDGYPVGISKQKRWVMEPGMGHIGNFLTQPSQSLNLIFRTGDRYY